jgi:hypothetical protein
MMECIIYSTLEILIFASVEAVAASSPVEKANPANKIIVTSAITNKTNRYPIAFCSFDNLPTCLLLIFQ